MDRRNTPAEQREFHSPNKKFLLTIRTLNQWKTTESTAVLWHAGRQLWSLKLPHELGPRDAVITDFGCCVLLDEWVSARTKYAVAILSRAGSVLRCWTFDDVLNTLESSDEDMQSYATTGWWMSGEPIVSEDQVRIPSAGTELIIDAKKLALAKLVAE